MQSELEVLIVQSKKNADINQSLLESLIIQGKNNNISNVLDAMIVQNEKVLKELKKSSKSISDKDNTDVVDAIGGLKPEFEKVNTTLVSLGAAMGEIAKTRGSKFLGTFEEEKDLPDDAKEGDFAMLNSGQLYYV